MNRRVVITGMGAVTPIGQNVQEFWNGIIEGKSGAGPITQFDASDYRTTFAMEIHDFDPTKGIDRKIAKNMDRFAQFAMVASVEAMDACGLDMEKENPRRCGVIMGSGIGGLNEIETAAASVYGKGSNRVSPFFVPKMMSNAASGNLAIQHGFQGPNFTTSSACASSQHAMGVAFDLIRNGASDVIMTGGAESTITPLAIGGFCSARAMSMRNDDPATASRPFSKSRDGFVMGEGAGILIFEEEQRARKRGAKIYGEVLGFGMTDDAHHMTAPHPEGLMATEAMKDALKEANVDYTRVNYVNAHGTSTPLNDRMETRAIRGIFGDHADKMMVSSTKSQVGHLLGASGSVELVAVMAGIDQNVVPPTSNYIDPDPDCDLDYVPNEAREGKIDVALSNSFGFGGHNACICVGRYND